MWYTYGNRVETGRFKAVESFNQLSDELVQAVSSSRARNLMEGPVFRPYVGEGIKISSTTRAAIVISAMIAFIWLPIELPGLKLVEHSMRWLIQTYSRATSQDDGPFIVKLRPS